MWLHVKGTKEEMTQAEEEFIKADSDSQPDLGPTKRKRKAQASKFCRTCTFLCMLILVLFLDKENKESKKAKRAGEKNTYRTHLW